MSSRVTSLAGLFEPTGTDEATIERIEIPIIQRDFAQGRTDERASRIRNTFLDVLREAATGGDPVGLDFVYGEVTDGTLRPLDGQQRLTTLFLLHWYVASRTGQLDATAGWAQLTYATRPGARRFCERLVQHALADGAVPSQWIRDQPWYLYVWAHDPTVQAMLVMLDAIHQRFARDDLPSVWERLVDPDQPAISFHLLPIDDMGAAEDLYIKMNSRGKPLTEFETFKAQLHKALEQSPRADELAERLDGRWADVMWPLRNGANIFDDAYLNYIRFIIELCQWRQNLPGTSARDDVKRAELVLAGADSGSEDNLDFLFAAFDVWLDDDAAIDSDDVFAALLTTDTGRDVVESGRLTVFGDIAAHTNLFKACCSGRPFGNRQTLMLYAVLLHRIHGTEDFPRRLRVVRNLIEASNNEIRAAAMPRLIADVERVVLHGALDELEGFNTEQCHDEIAKRDFLTAHPELEHELAQLEDHDMLRGCLMAFDYDAAVFAARAQAFRAVFDRPACMPALTGALLSVGDYSRPQGLMKYRFGPPARTSQWRELLADGAPSRLTLTNTRTALGELLDRIDPTGPIRQQLEDIQQEWLTGREAARRFDWRYYLVKYPVMRIGASGIYAANEPWNWFSLCMLEGTAMNGHYRDPYLLAIAEQSGAQGSVEGSIPKHEHGPWFTGPADLPRRMILIDSGTAIRCTATGFSLDPPPEAEHRAVFEEVCAAHGLVEADGSYVLTVPCETAASLRYDTIDRVQLGAALLTDLVLADL